MLIILCVEGIDNLKTTIKLCINSSTMQYHTDLTALVNNAAPDQTASRRAASSLFAIRFR